VAATTGLSVLARIRSTAPSGAASTLLATTTMGFVRRRTARASVSRSSSVHAFGSSGVLQLAEDRRHVVFRCAEAGEHVGQGVV